MKTLFPLSLLGLFFLAACGSSSQVAVAPDTDNMSSSSHSSLAPKPPDSPRLKEGYFIDAAVSGLGYRVNDHAGITDEAGRFYYHEGDTIEFHVGDARLPPTQVQPTITPLTLFRTDDPAHPGVMNTLRWLQSLDEDGDLSNGITISAEVANLATPIDFFQSEDDFANDPAVNALLGLLKSDAPLLVSAEDALNHFEQSLRSSVNRRMRLSASDDERTYEHINRTLGGTAVESPVCDYAGDPYGRRITRVYDSVLSDWVYAFHIFRDLDGDRCRANITDRQRIEIKTYNQSPSELLAFEGDIHTYRWRFRLDSGFQPSAGFTHLFQIKPQGGDDDSLPILTLTGRLASASRLELLFNPSDNRGKSPQRLAQTELSNIKGEWLEVFVRYQSADHGWAEVTLTRMSDGRRLIDWSHNAIDFWRAGANFNRPKWGIYRSLATPEVLRDESIRFADFCIAKATNTCAYD